jgi:hypothetical protein
MPYSKIKLPFEICDLSTVNFILVQLTFSTSGVTNGAMVGLFTFGMFYPRGNSQVGSRF